MSSEILDRVMQATRLTQAGRLKEATALLQRGLAGGEATGDAGPFSGFGPAAADVIEGDCTEVRREPPSGPVERSTAPTGNATTAEASLLSGLLRKWQSRGAPVTDPASGSADRPGAMLAGAYANAAGERGYKLFVPTGYSGQPLPLIVMLHGCKQNPDDFAAGTQMNALGEEHGCFVLYPAQSGAANQSGCWNWFQREHQVRDRGEPSILAGMTRSVMERYNVDARKIYVAGLSAGGAMAAVLGVTYPDLFAAVGIHSGLACGSAHDLPSALAAMKGMPAARANPPGSARGEARAIPTIVFHGDRDRTVHPRNGADVISQSPHHDERDTRVSTERGQAPGGHAYTRTVHCDSTGHVVLEHWDVHGGGHAWFGGGRGGSYTDPRGPDAAREMVRFFLQAA